MTQCHPNHNRTLIEPERERDALSREQFLREVNKGFHDGAFNVEGISHLSEDVIQLQAEECFDRWGQSLKGRDAPVALRSWLRKGQQLGTVEKPPKFLDANQVTQRAEPDNPIQPWHERISERLDEDVFNAWFRPVVFEDGILYAPSRFHAQYITQHYSHDIQAVFNQETPIEFKKPQPQKEKELA